METKSLSRMAAGWGVALAVLSAILVGVTSTLVGAQDSGPDEPPVLRRATADSCLLLSSACQGAIVRAEPTRRSARVGRIPQGTSYAIECQTRGAPVRDSYGASSDIWNRTTLDSGAVGHVPDTWGGRIGWIDQPCPAPDPRMAEADSCLYLANPCFGAIVREGPSRSFARIGRLAQGEEYRIDCQTTAQTIRNSLGESSSIWNRVVLAGGKGGWVADIWGGRAGWLDIQCGAGASAEEPSDSGSTGSADQGADAAGSGPDDGADTLLAVWATADSCLYLPAPCSGATVRSGPSRDFERLGRVAQGSRFVLDCQSRGALVRNSLGEASNVWNRVTVDGSKGGWMADIWSGRLGWLDRPC